MLFVLIQINRHKFEAKFTPRQFPQPAGRWLALLPADSRNNSACQHAAAGVLAQGGPSVPLGQMNHHVWAAQDVNHS